MNHSYIAHPYSSTNLLIWLLHWGITGFLNLKSETCKVSDLRDIVHFQRLIFQKCWESWHVPKEGQGEGRGGERKREKPAEEERNRREREEGEEKQQKKEGAEPNQIGGVRTKVPLPRQ